MAIRLNKNATLNDIRLAFKKLAAGRKNKPDLNQYFGKIRFKMDGLTYQKKIRNEWQ